MSKLKVGQLRKWNDEAYEVYSYGLITCEYFVLIRNEEKIWYYYEKGLIESDLEETLLKISDEVKDE